MSLLCGAAALALVTPALAGDADWLKCRQQTDPRERLSCYDAVQVEVPAPEVPAVAVAIKPPKGDGTGALAPAALPRQTPQEFGQDSRTALEAIETRYDGTFQGWNPRDRIRLANGQVWQVVDDSTAVLYLQNPKVRVRRGALGSYVLEVEGTNRSAKVKRLE